MKTPELDKELYEQALEFERIGNRAVRKAQERNRRLGVPNVYSWATFQRLSTPCDTARSTRIRCDSV